MTQRELAALADVSAQTIADFERGARQPHSNNIKAIREVFENRGVRFVEREGKIIGMDFTDMTPNEP